MGCLYSKMSRDSDDHYKKITKDDIDSATLADVESEDDVVCGPGGKSDILDLASSKDPEGVEHPSLEHERADEAAHRMQVVRDVTNAQLEELRRARDRLFKAFVCQEARQLARVFREAASADIPQSPWLLPDDTTWLTGGEEWKAEMTSFIAMEEEMLVSDGEEVEEKEAEEEEEMGDGEGVPVSFLQEALRVAHMIRLSPTIHLNQYEEDIDDASSLGSGDEKTSSSSSSCQNEQDSANIFLDIMMKDVELMVQKSALMNERAFLIKKIAYKQMLMLRSRNDNMRKAQHCKEASAVAHQIATEQTPLDDSPCQNSEVTTGEHGKSSRCHGDSVSAAEVEESCVMTTSTEDSGDVLLDRNGELEEDINDDGDRSSARVFLDWLMDKVEARVELDFRLLALEGRVLHQSHGGIPAFPGTPGMTWDEALRHIHREDTRRGKEEEEKREIEGEQGPGLRRRAIRNSWLFRLILQLDAEDEEREQMLLRDPQVNESDSGDKHGNSDVEKEASESSIAEGIVSKVQEKKKNVA